MECSSPKQQIKSHPAEYNIEVKVLHISTTQNESKSIPELASVDVNNTSEKNLTDK